MTRNTVRVPILVLLLALIQPPSCGSAQDGPQVVLRVLISPTHPFDPERARVEYRGTERTLYAYLVMESASADLEVRAGAVIASLAVYHTPHGGPEISPFQPAAGWRTVPRGTPVPEGSGPSVSAPSVLGWTKLTFRPDQAPMATVSVCPPADESDGYSPRVHGAGGTPPRLWLTYGAGINRNAPPTRVYPRWICSPPHGLVPAGDPDLARLIREEGLSQFPVRAVWSRATEQYLNFNLDGSVRRDVRVPRTFTALVPRSGGPTDERSLIAVAADFGRSVICRLSLETGEVDTLPGNIDGHIRADGRAFITQRLDRRPNYLFYLDGEPVASLPLIHGEGAFVDQEYRFLGWERPTTPVPFCGGKGGGDLEYCRLDASGRMLSREPIGVYGCVTSARFDPSGAWAAMVFPGDKTQTLVSGSADGVVATRSWAISTLQNTALLTGLSDGLVLCTRGDRFEVYDRMLTPATNQIRVDWASFGIRGIGNTDLQPAPHRGVDFVASTGKQSPPEHRANGFLVGMVDWSGQHLYQFQDVPGSWLPPGPWITSFALPRLTRASDRLLVIDSPGIGAALYLTPRF